MRKGEPVVTYSPARGKEFLLFFRVDSEEELSNAAEQLVRLGKKHINDRTLDEEYILRNLRMLSKMSKVGLPENKFQLSYDNGKWSVSIDWEQINPAYYAVFDARTDSEKNLYREIPISEDEILRITKVRKPQNEEASVRIQTRPVDEQEPIVQGPEIPIRHLDEVMDILQFLTAAQEALDDLNAIDLENDPQWHAAREAAKKEAQRI